MVGRSPLPLLVAALLLEEEELVLFLRLAANRACVEDEMGIATSGTIVVGGTSTDGTTKGADNKSSGRGGGGSKSTLVVWGTKDVTADASLFCMQTEGRREG